MNRSNGGFSNSGALDDSDGKSKGSKQKIIQLKDELNGGSLQINPKFEKLKVLRESYDIAKFRANELLLPHDQNLYIKAHGLRASKIYSALSTLIFVSISGSKVDELEEYVMKSAAQVPSTIFDLEEWSSIVKIAKDCREGDVNSLREQVSSLKKNLAVFYQLSANPMKAAQLELKLLRSEVSKELGSAQSDLAGSINLIMQLAHELKSVQHAGAEESNTRLRKLLQQESDVLGRKTNEAEKNVLELESLRAAQVATEESLQQQKLRHAELHSQYDTALARAESSESQNIAFQTRVNELEKELDGLKAANAVSPRHIAAEQQAQQVRDFQELYEQYNHLSSTLKQKEIFIAVLQEQIKSHSLTKTSIDVSPVVVVEEAEPPATPAIQVELEEKVAALTQFCTELEHKLSKEQEKVKSLGVEVRLTEAARCEAAGFAETSATDLAVARVDIAALQAEVAELRSSLQQLRDQEQGVAAAVKPPATNVECVSQWPGVLTKEEPVAAEEVEATAGQAEDGVDAVAESTEVAPTCVQPTDMQPTDVVMIREHSAVAESVDGEPVETSETTQPEPTQTEAEVFTNPVSEVVVKPAADQDARLVHDEAARMTTSALFLGTVHVAVMEDEFVPHHNGTARSHAETPAAASVSAAAVLLQPAAESDVQLHSEEAPGHTMLGVEASVAAETTESQKVSDALLIHDEAARMTTSALFLGTVHVAVMEDEFSHSRVGSPMNVPTDDVLLEAHSAVCADSLLLGTEQAQKQFAEDDTCLIATEAARVAASTIFLGAVRFAVMNDELVPHHINAHLTAPPVSPGVIAAEDPLDETTPTHVAGLAGEAEAAADARILSGEASRVATSTIFLGTVRVALQQDEFTRSHTPVSSANQVQEVKNVEHEPIDCETATDEVSTQEVLKVLASALTEDPQKPSEDLLLKPNVALVDEEPVDPALAVLETAEPEPTQVEKELLVNPVSEVDPFLAADPTAESIATPAPESCAGDDARLIHDEAARMATSALFLGTVHVAVMEDEFVPHHNTTARSQTPAAASVSTAAALLESAPESDGQILSEVAPGHTMLGVEASVAAETTESQKLSDARLVHDEAARMATSALFLGTVHVAVMEDEFVPHHNGTARSHAETPAAASVSAAAAILPESDGQISSGETKAPDFAILDVETAADEKTIPAADVFIKSQKLSDALLIHDEAARMATSALFLGTVHVAVMEDEFSHSHIDAAPVSAATVVDAVEPVPTADPAPIIVVPGGSSGEETVSGAPVDDLVDTIPVVASAGMDVVDVIPPGSRAETTDDAPIIELLTSTAELIAPEPAFAKIDLEGNSQALDCKPEQSAKLEKIASGISAESAISIPSQKVVADSMSAKLEMEAEEPTPWSITATKGSQQGKSGWYDVNGQLFYYAADNGEPVLLCGPVSDELYSMASAAETASRPAEEPTSTIAIDRLGARATRLQAEFLREEVVSLELRHAQAIHELEQSKALTEAELYDVQATVRTLNEEIMHCKDIIRHLESDRRRSHTSRRASDVIKEKIEQLTIEQVVALMKLTSLARGFIGRARVRRMQVTKLAQEAGILYAMANTKQGKSGWYMGPKRNVFYFALANGAWKIVAGPLSEEEFELMMTDRKQKQISNSQEVLTMCHVELLPDWEALVGGGDLFIANVTDKVYVCKSLDSIIAAAHPGSSIEEEGEEEKETEEKMEEKELNEEERFKSLLSESVKVNTGAVESYPEELEILRMASADSVQAPALGLTEEISPVALGKSRELPSLARSSTADRWM